MFRRSMLFLPAVAAALCISSCGYYYITGYHIVNHDRDKVADLRAGKASDGEMTFSCGDDARAKVWAFSGYADHPAFVIWIESDKPCVVQSVEVNMVCTRQNASGSAVYGGSASTAVLRTQKRRDSIQSVCSFAEVPLYLRMITDPRRQTLVYSFIAGQDSKPDIEHYVVNLRVVLMVDDRIVESVRTVEIRRVRTLQWQPFGSC